MEGCTAAYRQRCAVVGEISNARQTLIEHTRMKSDALEMNLIGASSSQVKSSQVGLTRVGVWVGRVIPGQPGSTRVAQVILGPLGHPEPVGSSHANPGFFSVHLTLNPAHPGQPDQPGSTRKTRSDPIFFSARAKYERLGSARLSDRLKGFWFCLLKNY